MIRASLAPCCAALALLVAVPAAAQIDEPPAKALTGALKRIRDTGAVRIGYREAAVPFSSASKGGKPYGYSIDLCGEIVEDIWAALGGRKLRVEYHPVTPEDRFDQVVDGRIDLECGSSSITEELRQRVAFSPVIFVAGTRLMVKRGGAVRSILDLADKSVVGVSGTTNARAMIALRATRVRGMRVLEAPGYGEALSMLDAGAADALAADDILIVSLLAERALDERYIMVGDPLAPEAYGIAFARGDTALAEVVQGAFARLAATRELRSIYDKWFVKPLPSGLRLRLPMSAELKRSFEGLGLPPE